MDLTQKLSAEETPSIFRRLLENMMDDPRVARGGDWQNGWKRVENSEIKDSTELVDIGNGIYVKPVDFCEYVRRTFKQVDPIGCYNFYRSLSQENTIDKTIGTN